MDRRARKARRSVALGAALAALALSLAACGGGTSSHASYATLVGQGMKLLGQGKTGAATQKFQQAIARDKANPVAYYDLGVNYQHRGNVYEAEHEYALAIYYGPAYVPALYNQAGLLVNSYRSLAVSYYRRIIRVQPNSPTAYLNLGLVEAASPATHKSAITDLTEAVKLDPALRAYVPPSLRADIPAAPRR